MSYSVVWAKRPLKQLLTISKRQRLLVAFLIKKNINGCDNPTVVGDCKRLEAVDDAWRWRIGGYRILARVENNKLNIVVFRMVTRQVA